MTFPRSFLDWKPWCNQAFHLCKPGPDKGDLLSSTNYLISLLSGFLPKKTAPWAASPATTWLLRSMPSWEHIATSVQAVFFPGLAWTILKLQIKHLQQMGTSWPGCICGNYEETYTHSEKEKQEEQANTSALFFFFSSDLEGASKKLLWLDCYWFPHPLLELLMASDVTQYKKLQNILTFHVQVLWLGEGKGGKS